MTRTPPAPVPAPAPMTGPASVPAPSAGSDSGSGSARPAWESLDPPVRARVEERLGSRVVGAHTHAGGFTGGVACGLRLADGRRAFLKGAPADHPDADRYADEIAVTTALPAGLAPRVWWSAEPPESGGWWWLCLDEVPGGRPVLAPGSADTAGAVRAVARAGRLLAPSPVSGTRPVAEAVGPWLTGWSALRAAPPADLCPWARRRLDALAAIERDWWPASAGDTLLHWDLHPGNMVRGTDPATGIVLVDWSYRLRGAAWIDAAVLVPHLILDGHTPAGAERAVADLPRPADPRALTAFAAGLAGLWASAARGPAALANPALRTHQERAAAGCLAWLRHRAGRGDRRRGVGAEGEFG
ncbi:aminoglycoside phosphotransferase (plasmid) [Streptomyces sp. BI20]|uniref:aminoglycoside phosphotransferase n=1 Tax=Streptomyces sp. BI20 TaxID=3403460 RepID=UPI003C75A5EC